MKKNLFTLFAIVSFSTIAYSQVGINTETPKATLDVVASDDTNKADGVIAPRLTGAELLSKNNAYGAEQEGVIIYATSASPGAGTDYKTKNVDVPGYYYFDGDVWVKMMSKKPFRALTNIDYENVGPDFFTQNNNQEGIDYFEFTSSDQEGGPYSLTMPSPQDYKNRTIYIRNTYKYTIYIDWYINGGVPTDPWETNYITQNIMSRDSAAFYSDGTSWVQVAGM